MCFVSLRLTVSCITTAIFVISHVLDILSPSMGNLVASAQVHSVVVGFVGVQMFYCMPFSP